MSDTERAAKLRAALIRIAATPCTGRWQGCKTTLAAPCPKHIAEAVLVDDDWDRPLDEEEEYVPAYTAEMRGLGATKQ